MRPETLYLSVFQFTLPRGERHRSLRRACIVQRVSIHAPARGATSATRASYSSLSVSIHAPARGATQRHIYSRHLRGGFNSRSREGSDEAISDQSSQEAKFQFTLPRGERHTRKVSITAERQFQFTLPRGERLSRAKWQRLRIGFNSRSREGSDLASQVSLSEYSFQFTLPRGERLCLTFRIRLRQGFNSRSREGSDVLIRGLFTQRVVSIHAPARGATGWLRISPCLLQRFQFTLPRGERP